MLIEDVPMTTSWGEPQLHPGGVVQVLAGKVESTHSVKVNLRPSTVSEALGKPAAPKVTVLSWFPAALGWYWLAVEVAANKVALKA